MSAELAVGGTLGVFASVVVWHRVVDRFRGSGTRALLRRLLYFIPASLLFVLDPEAPTPTMTATTGIAIAVGAATCLWIGSAGAMRASFGLAASGAMPLPPFAAALKIVNLLAGPLVQEPLYRAVLLWPLAVAVGPESAVAITTCLFVAEHRLHPSNGTWFGFADYIRQIAFGLLLGALSLATGSLMVAILGHFVFNVPPIVLLAARVAGSHAGSGAEAQGTRTELTEEGR